MIHDLAQFFTFRAKREKVATGVQRLSRSFSNVVRKGSSDCCVPFCLIFPFILLSRKVHDHRSILHDVISKLISHILTPRICIGCGEIGIELCDKCVRKLPIIDFQRCLVCDTLSLDGKTHKKCHERDTPDVHLSAFEYEKLPKKIVLQAKFHAHAYHGLEIVMHTKQVMEVLKSLPRIDCVIPVPMTEKWFDARIVNHAEVIATEIAQMRNVPLFKILRKTSKASQKQQSKSARARNLSIQIREDNTEDILSSWITDKNILIVDDVTTTGSTIRESISALATYRPAQLFSFTICKDMRYNRAY